tara:strand:- start:320 stop:574 length:255 start_codon:yes stop_codon:yes gene_type:complete
MNYKKQIAEEMYNEIWDIFNNYGGYDYNDTMWCQAQGSSDAFEQTIEDGNWEALVREYESVLKYMRHIKKILILQNSIPPQVYC